MKKITIFILAVVSISLNMMAQQRIVVGTNYANANEVTLVAERGTSTTIQFNLNELNVTEVETDYGIMSQISSAKAPVMLEEGVPELIYLPTSFIIPDEGSAELEISYTVYTDYENIEIAPSRGSITRNIDPATVPYVKGEVYNQDAFFPGTLATLHEPFIMRDVRGQSLFVYPVQYNPVTKTLRIYSEITITINYNDNEGINEFTTQKRNKSIDPAFAQMYDNLFINNGVMQTRGYPTLEEGEILIICHNDAAWMGAMQPYIDWKRTMGRKTTMVSTSAISPLTAANIKTYITNYYNNADNNLAYVLLVGDVAQIPFLGTSSAPSDVDYGILQGGNYLTVLIGRMSSETTAHVQTQVQRTVWYERDVTTADTWLSAAMGIASLEGAGGGHDGGEADYIHMNNIRTRLLNYGYNPVHQEHNGSTGVPVTSPAQISQHINEGVGIINYCNHGDVDAWTLSNGGYSYIYYTNSHVNQLQNAGKLPYIFSVACVNGKYNSAPPQPAVCFAEAWTRANQGGQPTGAVATFMATVNLSWLPPMTAQDEFNDLVMDIRHTAGGFNYGVSDHRFKTFAGLTLNATQRMIMRHGLSSDYKAWTVFGDPTLMIRTKTPEVMDVSHLSLIPLGTSEVTVDCDADGAVAAVSYMDDDEVILLGSAVVIDGIATIIFDEPIGIPVELTVAVTGFNKVTYISDPVMVGGDLELPEPQNLAFEVENANHVVLNWDVPEDKGLTVKGYNIYRNDDKITDTPVKDALTFTDIAPENGEYEYKVTAMYSTTLESEFSEPITVSINGMCIPIGIIFLAETEDEQFLISWEAPEYEGLELAGYNVYRNEEKLNDEILDATTLSFLDEEPELETRYCYYVEVIYNDCEEPLVTEEQCSTLAINDITASAYSIFPNPTTGNVTIEGIGLNRVEIYNVLGSKLVEYNNVIDHLQINVNNFADGLYFVKLYSETNGVVAKRLVIMK